MRGQRARIVVCTEPDKLDCIRTCRPPGAQAAAMDTVLVPTYPANSPARSATEFCRTPQEPSAASPNTTLRGNRYELPVEPQAAPQVGPLAVPPATRI